MKIYYREDGKYFDATQLFKDLECKRGWPESFLRSTWVQKVLKAIKKKSKIIPNPCISYNAGAGIGHTFIPVELLEPCIEWCKGVTIPQLRTKYHKKLLGGQEKSVLYLLTIDLEAPKIYKIGITDNFKQRLRCYNASLPFNIQVLHKVERADASSIEQIIIQMFKKYRWKGQEWFKLEATQLDNIKRIMSAQELLPSC